MEEGTVSVRDRIDGDLGAMPIAQAIEKMQQETAARTVRQSYSGHAGLAEKSSGHEY
jgi:threonyl-tRNA synthetase